MRWISALAVVALFGVLGCGGPSTTCDPGGSCSAGGSWQACCSTSQCYYKASDGTQYNCAGTDCASGNPSAASQIASWCASH